MDSNEADAIWKLLLRTSAGGNAESAILPEVAVVATGLAEENPTSPFVVVLAILLGVTNADDESIEATKIDATTRAVEILKFLILVRFSGNLV